MRTLWSERSDKFIARFVMLEKPLGQKPRNKPKYRKQQVLDQSIHRWNLDFDHISSLLGIRALNDRAKRQRRSRRSLERFASATHA
jgi:hypothetical protein